jgi:hypothetical protein
MVNATDYCAMAAEHHRLAGMCRSPEPREQQLRLEEELRTLADSEECLHGARARSMSSDPQIAKSATSAGSGAMADSCCAGTAAAINSASRVPRC